MINTHTHPRNECVLTTSSVFLKRTFSIIFPRNTIIFTDVCLCACSFLLFHRVLLQDDSEVTNFYYFSSYQLKIITYFNFVSNENLKKYNIWCSEYFCDCMNNKNKKNRISGAIANLKKITWD